MEPARPAYEEGYNSAWIGQMKSVAISHSLPSWDLLALPTKARILCLDSL
jgi:hypothetical protein